MKLLAFFALIAIAEASSCNQSVCKSISNCCAPCVDAGLGIACPGTETNGCGYGKISSRSKGQSQNAAKADNQFEDLQENLEWTGVKSNTESGERAIDEDLI